MIREESKQPFHSFTIIFYISTLVYMYFLILIFLAVIMIVITDCTYYYFYFNHLHFTHPITCCPLLGILPFVSISARLFLLPSVCTCCFICRWLEDKRQNYEAGCECCPAGLWDWLYRRAPLFYTFFLCHSTRPVYRILMYRNPALSESYDRLGWSRAYWTLVLPGSTD